MPSLSARRVGPLMALGLALGLLTPSTVLSGGVPVAQSTAELTLHTPKRYKDNAMAALVQAFESTAEHHGISFKVAPKKVKFGEVETPWQHEKFSLRKIPSGSLSAFPEVSTFQERSSIQDHDFSISASRRLSRVTRFLAAALTQVAFAAEDASAFDAALLSVSEEHLNSWQQMFAETPRFFPFMNAKSHKKLYEGFQTSFKEHLVHVERHPFLLSEERPDAHNVFYQDTSATLISIGRSKSVLFDLTHLIGNALFIGCLLFGAVGAQESKSQIKKLLTA
eukprot:Selendium_serpulae@DN4682_c0_g1_i1.p1